MNEKLTLAEELRQLKGAPQNFLFEGATSEEIEDVEKKIGRRLPQSFRFFLQASDGALLYQTETILGTKDGIGEQEGFQLGLVRIKEAIKAPDYLVPFYISAEVHFFDTREEKEGEYPVVGWDETKGETVLIANSFPVWLSKQILEEFETGTF